MRRAVLTVLIFAGFAVPAWPCSWAGPGPPAREELVRQSDVIVRARIDQVHDDPGARQALILVRFTVAEVIKGSLAASDVATQGYLENRDDFNEGPVPYDMVRPGGRHGNCVAEVYRQGAEYLLLLKRRDSASPALQLTPYWAALRPTNEQLRGDSDLWLLWVRAEVARQRAEIPSQE